MAEVEAMTKKGMIWGLRETLYQWEKNNFHDFSRGSLMTSEYAWLL